MDILNATLEDLKRIRPDLCSQLYQEFLMSRSLVMAKREEESKNKIESEKDRVKVGDALRWNYTGEEGLVVGFELFGGKKKIVVEQYDGTKINFDNNPRLYTILEGDDKEAVLSQRKKYLKESSKKQEPKDVMPKKAKKSIYQARRWEITPDLKIKEYPDKTPSPEDVKMEALVGDTIIYDSKRCVVTKKGLSGGTMRLIVRYDDGVMDNVPNDWSRYQVIKKRQSTPDRSSSTPSKRKPIPPKKPVADFEVKKNQQVVRIGDWVMRTSDGQIGKVTGIRVLGGGIEKLILELEDGSQSGVFKSKGLYKLVKRRK